MRELIGDPEFAQMVQQRRIESGVAKLPIGSGTPRRLTRCWSWRMGCWSWRRGACHRSQRPTDMCGFLYVCASGACAWTCSRASRTRLLRQPIGGTRNSCDLEAEA